MFADDSAIFADRDAEANEILQEIAAIALSYGLTVNAGKAKALTTDGTPCILCLNISQIEQVDEFNYLGSLVQQNKISCSTEIHSRIGKATGLRLTNMVLMEETQRIADNEDESVSIHCDVNIALWS
ncbi:unnamed protein product [Heligmosomoides polygyrus]|uniref:Reverse transcriptase domain-containing protein n=1 Tax=Heligmosomoides polygyrus TaxID=6339 RepID=A0A183GR38_HELPZ|nr:unnamed protein product [Heligmosomoides polygyrus]